MANEDPIAFLFTWSTYGTWLPGDARGWVEYKHGFQLPDPVRELEARARMTSEVVYLNAEQREQLHQQVAETCAHKGWTLLAVNCRSNHIRALISASTTPKKMRAALKAWKIVMSTSIATETHRKSRSASSGMCRWPMRRRPTQWVKVPAT